VVKSIIPSDRGVIPVSDSFREAFAANLRRRQHAKGVPQETWPIRPGSTLPVPPTRLENGAGYPGLEIFAKLATVLEVELAELLPAEWRDRGCLRRKLFCSQ